MNFHPFEDTWTSPQTKCSTSEVRRTSESGVEGGGGHDGVASVAISV